MAMIVMELEACFALKNIVHNVLQRKDIFLCRLSRHCPGFRRSVTQRAIVAIV